MKYRVFLFLLSIVVLPVKAQEKEKNISVADYEVNIKNYVDSLPVFDTHEHLIDPEVLRRSFFLDFTMLFMQNGYDDLVSAGMPDTLYEAMFNEPYTPEQKWKKIEPYWNRCFNTSFSRIILSSIRKFYGINDLNLLTVGPVSERIKNVYSTNWFDSILRDSCRIKYVIKDGEYIPGKDDYFRYEIRFDSWLTVRSKYRIDSLAILQLEPIYTLEDFVKSLEQAFEKEIKNGMVAIKVFTAYYRTLNFEKTGTDAARRVFRTLVNGEENFRLTTIDAKPLQDYMMFKLLDLARKYHIPVAFHTGIQSGKSKILSYSDPTLLTNLFLAYPDVKFVLYHGSFPFGGELSALAKTFTNVYIDMNWSYALSPTYAENYLNQWIEMVPVSRLTGFGGDCMVVENVFSEMIIAKRSITNVLCKKIKEGYLSESEAKTIVRKILYENATELYGVP